MLGFFGSKTTSMAPGGSFLKRTFSHVFPTALGVRTVDVAEGRDEGDARIAGMDDERTDLPAVAEPHVAPRPPAVHRLVDAVPRGEIAADAALTGADVDDVGIGVRHPDGADGGDVLFVRQGRPVPAAVRRLPQPARCGAEEVRVRLARNAGHRLRASSAIRPDEPPLHVAEEGVRHVLRDCCCREGEEGEGEDERSLE